jgi:hypothetical protein
LSEWQQTGVRNDLRLSAVIRPDLRSQKDFDFKPTGNIERRCTQMNTDKIKGKKQDPGFGYGLRIENVQGLAPQVPVPLRGFNDY